MNIFDIFISPFEFPFIQKALIVAIAISTLCAFLSCYLVLKGWALMGDAISHSILPGLVLAFMFGFPIIIGGLIAGVLCAILVGFLKDNSRIKEDTSMGIVFSGMFALGVVIFVGFKVNYHFTHILFGSLLGLSDDEVWQTLLVSITLLAIFIVKRKDLILYCFDPYHTKVVGLSPKFLHYGLLILLTLSIVISLKMVGMILVIAMLIAPGMTGLMLSNKFDKIVIIAIASANLSSILGTIISYHIDADIGPAIVIMQAIFFMIAVLINKIKLKIQYKS